MQITNISIENIRGIESLEIKPKALTVISGANGQGKSSVLAAIQTVFEGGHDFSLVKKGAKKGVVVLKLTDGTTITRTITAKASTLEVVTKDGDVKKSPAAYVATLAKGFGLDPIKLLTAKPKERGAFLLETSTVSFQPAEILKATGEQIDQALNIEGVDKFRKAIYERRTSVNVRKKEAEESAYGLKKSLPEDMDKDWIAELATVDGELAERSKELATLESEAKQQLAEVEMEIQNEFREKIRALELQRDEQLRNLLINYQKQKDLVTQDLSDKVAALTGRKTEAKAKAEEQQRAKALSEQVEKQLEKYRVLDKESDQLSKSLERLDELKAAKLAEDGIEGMEIVDGDIVVGGVPFDALNTATRYQLAFQIAARGAGELPLMICDQAEVFDTAAWEEIKEVAAGSGMQIIMARVDDTPLKVEAV